MRDNLRGTLLSTWAGTDPGAAMTYANGIAGKRARDMAISYVLQGWAARDAETALAWARQLPPGSLRSRAMTTAATALAEKKSGGGV